MKTTLVLTDFSENASHAAKTAVMMSSVFNSNLMLYHTRQILPTATHYSDFAGGPWMLDDFAELDRENKEKMEELADDLRPLISKLDPHLHKPVVHCESGSGYLAQNITEVVEKNNVELIVMGASSDSTFDHFFNGSETLSIIENATCPILVIPKNVELKKIKKVIFATDFDEADVKGLHYLVKFGKLLNFKIEIVHVCPFGEKEATVTAKEEYFFKHIDKLRYPDLHYKEIKGKDVVKRLNNLCEEDGANILSLVHYQHSFLVRFFGHSTTKEALLNQNIPLLVFPSKME